MAENIDIKSYFDLADKVDRVIVKDEDDFNKLFSAVCGNDPDNPSTLINIFKSLDHIPITSGVLKFAKKDPFSEDDGIDTEYLFAFFTNPAEVFGDEHAGAHLTIDYLTRGTRYGKVCRDVACRTVLCIEFDNEEDTKKIGSNNAIYSTLNPFNEEFFNNALKAEAKKRHVSADEIIDSLEESYSNVVMRIAYGILGIEYLALINKENYIISSKNVVSLNQEKKGGKKKSKNARSRVPLIRNIYTVNLRKDDEIPKIKLQRKVGPRQFEFTTRGHWRHYKSGKVIWINEHLNCVGKPRKPKDYVANVD